MNAQLPPFNAQLSTSNIQGEMGEATAGDRVQNTPHPNPLPQGERRGNSSSRDRHERQTEGPIYVFAKRTQFFLGDLLVYPLYFQLLMPFTGPFFNWVRFPERTQLPQTTAASRRTRL